MKVWPKITASFTLDVRKGLLLSALTLLILVTLSGINARSGSVKRHTANDEALISTHIYQCAEETMKAKGAVNALMDVADCDCPSAKKLSLPSEYNQPLSSRARKELIAEDYLKRTGANYRYHLLEYCSYRIGGPVQKTRPEFPK